MEERFYFCETCGNLLLAAVASGVIPYCCGDEMTLLEPNTTDGNAEKHVPVVNFVSDHEIRVCVGADPHPMVPHHSIRFVCLQTNLGYIIRYLAVGEPPEVSLRFEGTPVAVYAYCNVHGLWRTEV